MVFRIGAVILVLILASVGPVGAEEFILKNGDRISGTLVAIRGEEALIATDMFGEITVLLEHLQSPLLQPAMELEEPAWQEEAPQWDRTISMGYAQSGGNTQKSQGNLSFQASRKTGQDEWTMKGNAYYSSSEQTLDGRKFYGMLRYAFSFGDSMKWYNFYKMEGDQDRFANIDYRMTPSAGLGYWFADTEDWKAMAEFGVGFEHTSFRDGASSTSQAILVPRFFGEKQIITNVKLTQDLFLYPSLEELGEYRLHSETALVSALGRGLALKFSLIDDFNSNPSGSAKKNDYKFLTSLDYSF